MLIGTWKNLEDLENHLTMGELEIVLSAFRDQTKNAQRFAASLKGIDLDDVLGEDNEDAVERAKIRAEARLRGENPEIAEFAELGISMEIEEE